MSATDESVSKYLSRNSRYAGIAADNRFSPNANVFCNPLGREGRTVIVAIPFRRKAKFLHIGLGRAENEDCPLAVHIQIRVSQSLRNRTNRQGLEACESLNRQLLHLLRCENRSHKRQRNPLIVFKASQGGPALHHSAPVLLRTHPQRGNNIR